MFVFTVALKLASSPNAAANSLRVFNAEGEESTRLLTAVLTYDSVAYPDRDGIVGVPVKFPYAK